MNRTQVNLQDTFLNQARKENIGVTIYLVNGVQLRGIVRGFDSFTVLLDSPGKPTQLVYKHSITSVVPTRAIPNMYHEALRESGQGDLDESDPRERPRSVSMADAGVAD
jgi:host factor-I protein